MTTKTITQDDLWNAVYELGPEGDASNINADVAAKLIELKMAERSDNGLQLTRYGEKAFVVLESGDGRVHELEDFPPVGA